MIWLWPALAIAAFVAGVLALRLGDGAQLRSSLVAFDLRFARGLEEAAVQAFLGAVSGLLPPWWRRWWHTPFIAFEVHADHRGTRHRLLVPRRYRRSVEIAFAAHLPAVAYEPVEGGSYPRLRAAAEYRITTGDRPLAVEPSEVSARLLAALQPLGRGEAVVVQWLLAPAAPVAPARLARADERGRTGLRDEGVMPDSEATAALRRKQSAPLLIAVARVGAASGSRHRARSLVREVEASWHATRAPGVLIKRRGMIGSAASRLTRVWTPLNTWPARLNTQELSGLVGFPIGADHVSGLSLTARPWPVAAVVPRDGTVLGQGVHPRTRRAVALDAGARTHHLLVVGPTGSGKSVLQSHLAVHDALGGGAVVVIDPKDGTLVDGVAERLPEERLSDVIVLDPTDTRPVGFDPLKSNPDNRELVVDRVLAAMHEIWGDNLGPRSADILRHLLLTVAAVPNLTLTEAPLLLSDPSFRRAVLARHELGSDVAAWWSWVDSLSNGEWTNMTQAPANKLRALVGRSAIADTLGQSAPALDLADVVAQRRILLVRLPAGLLGEETTALLGAMLLTQLWQAIAARAGVPVAGRRPASVVIDEVGSVLRFPGNAVETMLTQARGYGVGVTLAIQHLAQLPASVRSAAMANARSKVMFGGGRDDAGVFAREFGGELKPEDFTGLPAFHALAAVHAEGRTQPPCSIATVGPSPSARPAELVLAQSRMQWGQARADIAAAREARRTLVAQPSAVGRRRRAS